MGLLRWPFGGLLLVALAIAVLSAPDRLEGPVLVPIGPGHALSALDSLAMVPLLLGCGWLYAGLWRRRDGLFELLREAPGASLLGILVAGFGLGLLIASSWSAFFWWWAVGAGIFGTMNVIALLLAWRREREPGPRGRVPQP